MAADELETRDPAAPDATRRSFPGPLYGEDHPVNRSAPS